MRERKTTLIGIMLLAGLCFCLPVAEAQDQQEPEAPKPAAKAIPPIGEANDQESTPSADQLEPDNRPLTGIQQPTLGVNAERHSYWIPGVFYTNFIQSNAFTQGGGSSWTSTSYLGGNLSLLENWSRSQLAVNYSGGGSFSTDSNVGNNWYQQAGMVETFNRTRWQLTILDQFSYLPQAQFGFGVGSGLAIPGVGGPLRPGLPGLQPGVDPSQDIFTATGPRYQNSFGTQINYELNRRSSVTLGAVASLLRFTESGNFENNSLYLNAGYNYRITRTDTLGVAYNFSAYHYIDEPQAIGSHSIRAVYGKKITGRVALQLAGGPQITTFRIAPTGTTQTSYVAGTVNANLTYALQEGSLSVNYLHGVTNGSGVFLGSTADRVIGLVSHRLSRVWSGSANVGYAHNRSVQRGSGIEQGQTFDSIYVGGAVARPLARNLNFHLAYNAYIQLSNIAACVGSNCSTNYTTHQITIGFGWHTRPFLLP
jgi:hypothetical protein